MAQLILFAFSAFLTSILSAVLGMAGGMILMGVYAGFLPIADAMILHGCTQLTANGSRSYLLREHIDWSIVRRFLIGMTLAGISMALIQFTPNRTLLFLLLGCIPFAALWMSKRVNVSIEKPKQAIFAGFVVTIVQLMAGVSGPVLDVFFVKTKMTRHQIVGTKAFVQATGHTLKILYFGILITSNNTTLTLPLILTTAFFAIAGTRIGRSLLDRLKEKQFKKAYRFVVALLGLAYLCKGSALWITG